MSKITKIWLSTLTKSRNDAGTNDNVTLVITSSAGVDLFQFTFDTVVAFRSDTHYFRKGQASLFGISLPNGLNRELASAELAGCTARVAISGENAWSPEHIFVWAEDENKAIHPLAMSLNYTGALSSDRDEGVVSKTIARLESPALRPAPIERVLMLAQTNKIVRSDGSKPVDAKNFFPGTDDNMTLKIVGSNGVVLVDHKIENTSQADLEPSTANWYFVPVKERFVRGDLNESSIEISTDGKDSWKPKRLFIFGLDSDSGRVQEVTPISSVTDWKGPLKFLSLDPNDIASAPSQLLPLVAGPTQGTSAFPVGGVVA